MDYKKSNAPRNTITRDMNALSEEVQKDFMSIVTIVIKTFSAFCNGQEIIISTSCSYIKKVSSSFSSSYTFAVNTFIFSFVIIVVFVRHCN